VHVRALIAGFLTRVDCRMGQVLFNTQLGLISAFDTQIASLIQIV
jgi:hypothetical protein